MIKYLLILLLLIGCTIENEMEKTTLNVRGTSVDLPSVDTVIVEQATSVDIGKANAVFILKATTVTIDTAETVDIERTTGVDIYKHGIVNIENVVHADTYEIKQLRKRIKYLKAVIEAADMIVPTDKEIDEHIEFEKWLRDND